MHLEAEKMSDKELDEAIANHLKKLDSLQMMSECMVKENEDSTLNTLNDWNDNTSSDWKCKNLFSITKLPNQYPSLCYAAENDPEEEKVATHHLLIKSRDYLADYQETHYATPKSDYSFFSLVKLLTQITGKSVIVLLYIFAHAALVGEIIIFALRFILDKLVSIKKTKNHHQVAAKSAIFSLQLIGIYLFLYFIIGFIWKPIIRMVLVIIFQILLY